MDSALASGANGTGSTPVRGTKLKAIEFPVEPKAPGA